MRDISKWWLLVLLLCSVGCDQAPWNQLMGKKDTKKGGTPPSTANATPSNTRLEDPGVLALVNGTPITIEQFKARVEVLPEDDPRGFMTSLGSTNLIHRKPRTPEERRVLVEELIKEELAFQDAVTLGVEREKEVKTRLDQARRLILLEALAKRDLEGIKISDDDVKEFYQKNAAIFTIPARVHVRQMVVKTLSEAESLRATATGGVDFATLAGQHSIGAGKDQGGDVGWYLKEQGRQIVQLTGGDTSQSHTFFPQLESVAFSLEIGQVSQPVKGPDGNYYIVKLEQQEPERPKQLTEVWDQIREALLNLKRQQALQDHFARLWKQGSYQMNERRLEQL